MAGEGLKYFTVVSWWDGLLLHAARVMPPKGTALRGVVLLVHGMSEHKERYAKTMRYLAAHGYACVIYDHRGTGIAWHREGIWDIWARRATRL